ncbi:hypothetical protein CAEBREN_06859 [Caenorhabditis brenneri]|uniref:Receptor L-domain domain-containing protein n=1 Tax=Caenorhabditis brenneri TaxID=135651 RepID=G0MAH2_CAEBE|nr:hypothetical protein CAEBREN_06859 [Caenorhabditis brenneri]
MSFFVLFALIFAPAAFTYDFNGDFSRLYNPSICVENSVTNNPNLIDAKWLYTVKYSYTDSPIKVMNNSKLDVSSLCTSRNYEDFVRLYVSQNKKDCGCIGTVITTKNANDYKNCTSMFGTIEITNISDASSFTALANLKNITGNITIHNTGFQNLSFLTNLRSIVGDEPEGVATLNIVDNPNMTRFSIESLKTLYHVKDWFYMNIQNVHPEFCLTMEEMQFFTSINTKFTNLQAVYCNITTRKDNQKTCYFGSMSTLDNSCVHVIGRVFVGPGDESYIGKFSTIQYIYGSLTIQNTTLSSLSFLANLTNVALLNDTGPAIQLLNNPSLSDIYLENMAFPFSAGPNRFVIRNNDPNIFEDTYACQNYQNQVRSAVLYNGGDCSMMLLPNEDNGEEEVDEASTRAEKSTYRPKAFVVLPSLVLITLLCF